MNNKDSIEKKVIALTGGSTGGHVFPLLSLYNYLKEEKIYNFLWVGEDDSIEENLSKENGIKFLDIPAGKIRRYFDWKNFFEPLKNLSGIFFGIHYIIKYKIDIIFSKGGYVALPLCIAGFIMRKKIYIHESDTVQGLTNKIIGRIATKIFYTFPNDETEKNDSKHILSGQILNPELIDRIKSLDVDENEQLSVLITGGSQGSTVIFQAMLEIIPRFQDVNFSIILGEKNFHFKEKFEKLENVTIYDFVSQRKMGEIYRDTDIAITRGGATTLWELAFFGIHSIIIPLKGSAGNHQEKNAEYFSKTFGSDILNQDDLYDKLPRKLNSYMELRKSGLNLGGFFNALKIIEKEIN